MGMSLLVQGTEFGNGVLSLHSFANPKSIAVSLYPLFRHLMEVVLSCFTSGSVPYISLSWLLVALLWQNT